MTKFKSITVPKATYEVLNQLKNQITTVPLSTSKVVSIIAQDYRNTHEKERSNDETYLHKKSITR
jgi:hypothetical protein